MRNKGTTSVCFFEKTGTGPIGTCVVILSRYARSTSTSNDGLYGVGRTATVVRPDRRRVPSPLTHRIPVVHVQGSPGVNNINTQGVGESGSRWVLGRGCVWLNAEATGPFVSHKSVAHFL